jgi:GNAT superfamily N-acetyltransferase
MKIIKENNKITFNDNNIALAHISLTHKDSAVFLELIKVDEKCRRRKCATILMYKILTYLKENGYKKIALSPLPLESHGITLEELINFYTHFGFKKSQTKNRAYPYLMDMVL